MSLSGGQKQRTAIGVAALRDAEVLILMSHKRLGLQKHGERCRNFKCAVQKRESHPGDFP